MSTLFRSSRKLLHPRPYLSTQSHISPLFLQLPSSLRSRAFHASPRPQFIAEAIVTSHSLLESLHSVTGLPWAYTLPLFAVALRTTVFLPISIWIRGINQKQVSLSPVIQSWTHPLRKETIAEVGHLGPAASQKRLIIKMRRKRAEIFKRWGCQQWKNFVPAVVQIPIFLTVMESVRRMCGTGQGWLGMMLGSAKDAESASGTMITGDGLLSSLDTLVPVDTSLATEGALWFPNLLMADPHLVLPFALSATILLNIFGGRKSNVGLGKWQIRFRRNLGLLGLAIGPIMINVPSALLVYWIGSSMSAYLQAVLLDKFMPIKKPVEPCKPKRPWRTGLGAEILAGRDAEIPRAINPDALPQPQEYSRRNRRH
jgi:inner membrane protein COX18